MFQRILVPVDGSARAEQALPVAARMARATGGTIILLRVASIPSDFQVYSPVTPEVVQASLDAAQEEARSYLQGLAHHLVLAGLPLQTAVVAGVNQAATVILSMVSEQKIDLVVLSSHGYTGFKRWVLGSVAEKVVHLSPVPVLLFREGGMIPIGSQVQRHDVVRALVPLDGSAEAKSALAPAASLVAALATPGKGALHLARVATVPPGHTGNPERQKAALARAKRYLSSTVEHIREGLVAPNIASLNLSLTWSVIPDGDVASSIINMAETGEDAEGAGTPGRCDLIVMATHGYSGLQHWAMGSVTERVLRATKLPLLIVRSTPSTGTVKH